MNTVHPIDANGAHGKYVPRWGQSQCKSWPKSSLLKRSRSSECTLYWTIVRRMSPATGRWTTRNHGRQKIHRNVLFSGSFSSSQGLSGHPKRVATAENIATSPAKTAKGQRKLVPSGMASQITLDCKRQCDCLCHQTHDKTASFWKQTSDVQQRRLSCWIPKSNETDPQRVTRQGIAGHKRSPIQHKQ